MSNPRSLLNYFLNSGDFGTFSKGEKWLAQNVFETALEELRIKGSPDSDDEEDGVAFQEKIQATMKNFKLIIELFKVAENAKKKYGKKFPIWSPKRMGNSSKLRELAENINTDRRNCNISRITSSCVSVLGGIAIGASFAFPPIAPVLAVGGLVTSTLGGATVFGTSIAETKLLKKNMDEAKEVKKKDEKDFKEVGLWFKHSQALIDAFENIMGFSVASQLFDDLKNFSTDIGNAANLTNGKMPHGLVNIVKNVAKILLPAGLPLAVSVTSTAMALIPIAISFFVVIVLMRKHNSLIFDAVVLCHRIGFGMVRLLDLGGDLGVLITAAVMRAGGAAAADITANTARVVAHGVFAGLGLALDVTNIVLSSIDVDKGSISPHATQLQQAADQLDREHQVLERIYKELFEVNQIT